MKPVLTAIMLIIGAIILSSCQTMSKDECVAADWRVIGERDGAEGYDPQQRFGNHAKACERANVIPDQALWYEGYQRGLLQFCTPLRGLSYGQAGKSYNNVCPPVQEAGFLSGYRLGMQEHSKRSDVNNLKNRIASAERQNDLLREQIKKGKVDKREAQRTIRRNRDDILDWNRDLGRAEAELDQVEREVEYFLANPANSGAYN